MTKEPLSHEPGLDERHRDFFKYQEIVRYKNIQLAMLDVFKNEYYKNEFSNLFEIAKSDLMDNLEIKKEIIYNSMKSWDESNIETNANNVVYTSIYSMAIKIDYNILIDKLIDTARQLQK